MCDVSIICQRAVSEYTLNLPLLVPQLVETFSRSVTYLRTSGLTLAADGWRLKGIGELGGRKRECGREFFWLTVYPRVKCLKGIPAGHMVLPVQCRIRAARELQKERVALEKGHPRCQAEVNRSARALNTSRRYSGISIVRKPSSALGVEGY